MSYTLNFTRQLNPVDGYVARLPDERQINVSRTLSETGVAVSVYPRDAIVPEHNPSGGIMFFPNRRVEKRVVQVGEASFLMAGYKDRIESSEGLPDRLKRRAIQALDELALELNPT